mgnify:CR=1 FL=1
MKERPILFSGPMVRAILDGWKTQTRRIVKGAQPTGASGHTISGDWFRNERLVMREHKAVSAISDVLWSQECPYGRVGDRLWVRETWAFELGAISSTRDENAPLVYAADGEQALRSRLCDRWRPSIHMPRWASRINLEITGIRVERLQDISETDARAEGAEEVWFDHGSAADRGLIDMPCMEINAPFRNGYALLWDQINGRGSWAGNPWVWVYDFCEVHP